MNLAELKSGLHQFIDQIDSEKLLGEYYNEMNRFVHTKAFGVWDSLTDEQKREVLLSFEESEDENKLLENHEVMARYNKWL